MDELRAAAQAVVAARDRYGWSPEVDAEINRMRAVLASPSERQEAAAAGQESEAFEAEFRDREKWGRYTFGRFKDGDYKSVQTAFAWSVWQARASPPASPSQGQWQPIETAPRNHLPVLVELCDGDIRRAFRDASWTWYGWDRKPLRHPPTRWQPLPAAPSQPAQGDA